jgi:hypothetical protein
LCRVLNAAILTENGLLRISLLRYQERLDLGSEQLFLPNEIRLLAWIANDHHHDRRTHTMAARAGKTTPEKTTPEVDAARQQIADRITVALIPKVGAELQRLQDRTSLSKTDIANRAITLYEFIDAQLREGRDVLIRDNDTGETQTVRLL